MGKSATLKPKRLPEKLAQVRAAFSLSQSELISRLSFTGVLIREEVSAFERGRRQPPLTVLLEYARAAGVYVDVLIDDDVDLPDKLPSAVKSPGFRRHVMKRKTPST